VRNNGDRMVAAVEKLGEAISSLADGSSSIGKELESEMMKMKERAEETNQLVVKLEERAEEMNKLLRELVGRRNE